MPVEFNQSQERFAAITIDQATKTDKPRIIFGCGLTGVGKNTVLEEISPDLNRLGGKVVSIDYLLDPLNHPSIAGTDNHLVTSFTPKKFETVQTELVDKLGLEFVGVRVMTMTAEETLAYIDRMRAESNTVQGPEDLTDHNLALLTMGVYNHINKFFELKAKGEFYQPWYIKEVLRQDLPESLRSGAGFRAYLAQVSHLPQLWGQMGIK